MTQEIVLKNVNDIKIIDELYPRSAKDTKVIQQYADNIDVLPAIEINQNDILIDGAHRLSAYKHAKLVEIPCIITHTDTDQELFMLALVRNAGHGLQLSQADKRRHAIKLCGAVDDSEIIKWLSVSDRTYRGWTTDKRKQLKEDRDMRILDLYLQCRTQESIAEEINEDQSTISRAIDKIMQNGKSAKLHNDFKPQLYNIWNFAKNTNETQHPGQIPHEIIENLLYYYTNPFDVVFDPFGGGGVTIDVCKAWQRRYFVSDIRPTEIAKEKGMRTHDIAGGLPDGLPKPNLVFLDPPYWNQMQGDYTELPNDLSNVTLEEFYGITTYLFNTLFDKMVEGGRMAFIIQNTQWKTEDKHVEPHSHIMWNIAEAAGFKFEHLIQVPYSTQQYNAQMVECAKEHKIILQLNRELVILRKL
jgi:DNA modification methylase